MWTMPGVQPCFLPREHPLSLHKVPSVFAPTLPTTTEEPMDVSVESRGSDSCETREGIKDDSVSEEEEEQLKLSFFAQLKVSSIS